PAKMLRELEKGDVLFAHGIQDADSADALTCQPHNGAPRAAELALERVYLFRLEPVMLFEEPFQNFHDGLYRASVYPINGLWSYRRNPEAIPSILETEIL